jgi:integrase
MYRHGLRISEAVALTWDDITFGKVCTVRIERRKGSNSGTHYLDGDEIRLLRALHRLDGGSRFIFTSERGGPLSVRTARHVITSAGRAAGVPVTNPHALRHGTGYRLTRKHIDLRRVGEFLGHRDPKSTLIYSALDPSALAGLERD